MARGAVCKGLDSDNTRAVTNRKCRRHYGTDCSEKFDGLRHDGCETFVSKFDGVKRASGQMEWLLKRGDNLLANKTSHAELAFSMDFWLWEKRESSLTLYCSTQDKAPKVLKSTVSIWSWLSRRC